MRLDTDTRGEHRSSALWGRGGRETRASALWGRGGRGAALLTAVLSCLLVPAAGLADDGFDAAVPKDLLAAARANPQAQFQVVVQGEKGRSSRDIGDRVVGEKGKLKRTFRSVTGVSATVTGAQLLELADDSHVATITSDSRLRVSDLESAELWRKSTNVDELSRDAPAGPAIAIIDSGIDPANTRDFGSRVVARMNFSSLSPGATGDALGHGTMVAGIAGGDEKGHRGASPRSPLVDLRVTSDAGEALTSDIIAAIDWILANKSQYNIRVANLSLAGTAEASILTDPLDRAVERLWLSGVVVVAAAGNHGSTAAVKLAAPANDPFIITVGAVDQLQTENPFDDVRAPWSAYGYTADGFAKPELVAPGRWMTGPVPALSQLALQFPLRNRGGGYIWMSGTSFSAPVVAGAAAQLLGRHPNWSPDQVKGALMVTARQLPSEGLSVGIGEIDAQAATAVDAPPNPNENLNAFVSGGGFDAAAWAAHVSTASNWTTSNWTASNWVSSNWVSSNWVASNWVSSNWVASNWVASNWVASNWVE